MGGEEEGVDAGAELAECEIGRSEKGAAGMRGGGEGRGETGFEEGELKGGELAGEEGDDLEGGWGWEKKGVDTVNNTVGAELEVLVWLIYEEERRKLTILMAMTLL